MSYDIKFNNKTKLPIGALFEKTKDGGVAFKGAYMEIYLSPTDMGHGLATIVGKKVYLYGIFEIRIWNTVPEKSDSSGYVHRTRYMYPSTFNTIPSSIIKRSMSLLGEENESYTVLIYNKGDTFIESLKVPQQGTAAADFATYATKAFAPKVIKYEELAPLISETARINEIGFDVASSVFEIMFAAQARYAKDETIPYRIFLNKRDPSKPTSGDDMKFVSVTALPHILDTFASFGFREIDYSISASAGRHRGGKKTKESRKSDMEKLLTY